MSEKIEVEFKGDIIKGVLIKEDIDYITIKLSSGYNANLKKTEVKVLKKENETEKILKYKMQKGDEFYTNLGKDLPNITIIHTGGTIASKVDYFQGQFIGDKLKKELEDKFKI